MPDWDLVCGVPSDGIDYADTNDTGFTPAEIMGGDSIHHTNHRSTQRMTARTYQLDPNAAKAANSGGARITEAGPFVGKITQAWHEVNQNGTEAFVFSFESANGQKAGQIALYTHNGEGKELPSFDTVCSLLAVLRLRGIRPKPGKVTVYDYDRQEEVIKDKDTYPEVAGKAVGVFFRLEEYVKQRGQNAGEIGTRLIVHGFFDPASKLMAGEILDQQREPKQYERELAYVEREPVKKAKNTGQARQRAAMQNVGMGGTSTAGGFDDGFADDDIPF